MNIEPEVLNPIETEIIKLELLDYLYAHIFVKSKHLDFEKKVSRYLAVQEKLNAAFKESNTPSGVRIRVPGSLTELNKHSVYPGEPPGFRQKDHYPT